MSNSASSTGRADREKASYNTGSVVENGVRLHRRFHHVFECPNSARGEAFFLRRLGEAVPGKDILDYGCYSGYMLPLFQRLQARSVAGIDISDVAIAEARERFPDGASFHVGDAHRMDMFDDASFDVVYGRAILHHLEFRTAIREVIRVLRPGGFAFFAEPVGDNPASKLFRRMTPRARTRDEEPLHRQDIEWADMQFGSQQHSFHNLASTPIAMATSFTAWPPDNPMLRAADWADVRLARTSARYWMRIVFLVWQKVPSSA